MGRRLVFDIEANGLLDTVTRAHCIVAFDYDTDERFIYRPDQLEEGLKFLLEADVLLGHNIIGYDVKALAKLYGVSFSGIEVFDSLVASRLLDPDRVGGHSLKAWGVRLGEFKGDYGEQEDAWDEFSEEMLTYCIQDVNVNVKIIKHLIELMGEEDVPTFKLF